MADVLAPQLAMSMNSLDVLPRLVLPEGYDLKSFAEGDAAAWEEIIHDSFGVEFSFAQSMATSQHFRPERVKFIRFDGTPIATASAWSTDDCIGYLHMVGVHSKHLGHGLGGQVSLAALYQMASEGRTRVLLNTDDFRIPAIKTYLKLGFVPLLVHHNHIQRWTSILTKIGRLDILRGLPNAYRESD